MGDTSERPAGAPDPEAARVRIVSDGVGFGTKVYSKDGQDLTNVLRAISWRVEAGGGAEVELELASCAGIDASGTVVRIYDREGNTVWKLPK